MRSLVGVLALFSLKDGTVAKDNDRKIRYTTVLNFVERLVLLLLQRYLIRKISKNSQNYFSGFMKLFKIMRNNFRSTKSFRIRKVRTSDRSRRHTTWLESFLDLKKHIYKHNNSGKVWR
jgi:hypothetical protein